MSLEVHGKVPGLLLVFSRKQNLRNRRICFRNLGYVSGFHFYFHFLFVFISSSTSSRNKKVQFPLIFPLQTITGYAFHIEPHSSETLQREKLSKS